MFPSSNISSAESHVTSLNENATLMRYEIKIYYSNIQAIADKYMQGMHKRSLSTQDIANLKYSITKIRDLTQKINATEHMSTALHRLNCEKTLIDSERALVQQITPILKKIRRKRKKPTGKTFEKQVDKFLDSEHDLYSVANYLKEISTSDYTQIPVMDKELDYDEILKNIDQNDESLGDFLTDVHASNIAAALPNVPNDKLSENNAAGSDYANSNKLA